MNVDLIPSPVIEPVSPTIIEEQDLVTEETDVDTQGEKKNPIIYKNLMKKIELCTKKPKVPQIQEDDERKESDEPREHAERVQQCIADPTQ